jgi:hypothetical protein
MTGFRPGFDPDELRGSEGSEPTDAELGQLLAMGRELSALAGERRGASTDRAFGGGLNPDQADLDFVARVMAAVEREPAPRPMAAAGRAARELRPAGVLASVRDAWRVAFGPGRTLAARAGALSYVLAILVIAGSLTGVAVVGTAALLAPAPTQLPGQSAPATVPSAGPAGPPSSTPAQSHAPAASSPSPSESPKASEEPEESDDHGSVTASPAPTADVTSTPRASRTPRPSETPEPTSTSDSDDHTPEPSETPHEHQAG